MMNILVIGSGGREHALCWAIAKSSRCERLFCAPGNAGIAAVAECVGLDAADHDAVIAFCRTQHIGFVVVGPEVPLVAGIADDLRAAGIKTFGPGRQAARLEGSKGFTKDICARHGIPTAAYGRFADKGAALDYLKAHPAPIVIKADGLAAGKGVIIAETQAQAIAAVEDIFGGRFGSAGAEVVIEEYLEGEEASFFALCDGRHAVAFGTAQDHKRVGEGDVGPNTGGMGAYSPAPVMDAVMCERVLREIIRPTVDALAEMDCPYQGVLFAGLMMTAEGPKLIEYNCRFGDPECQVLMMRLTDDVVDLLLATSEGGLDAMTPTWRDEAALTVVMAAKGYPGDVEKGSVISGLDAAAALEGVEVFHAGTRSDDGRVVANGGRVLNVTALGANVSAAAARAYEAVGKVEWPEGFYRRDIGWRAIAREKETVS
jgi:phosphoribosylamine--glycine ligase